EGTRWEAEESMEGFLRLKGARDLSRRELAVLREVANWRDTVAAQLDRATFRVMGNEALFEIARRVPKNATELGAIKGMPKGMIERAGGDIISAIRRGMEAPEAELPKFPKGQRWNKDRDFDEKVNRLKVVRDAASTRLELDPGVLCSREKLENVARSGAKTIEDLAAVPELRRWQIEEMGEGFVRALQAA
ncbi:MAG TPA: HRDC domain-containing protein, partial [Gemmatimonadaceae bacterium]|nr:HRDC domain-containing protein [Gemmatimonadaceae bacterium]